ncbi:MAG: UDP-N-acetylglucosamine 1-carboxyvinyltransferase [Oscillospiraceae bacterium]
MSKLIINGKNTLNGEVTIGGAKNSTLPLIAATILCDGETVLHNCPHLSDVETCIKIISGLGGTCKWEQDTIIVDTSNINKCEIPENLMREMRSSIVFLGAIIARCGAARLSSPGGCELGPRPIDLHLKALRKMGVEIHEDHGLLDCKVKTKINGADISLSIPSVGATENIMLAAVLAEGITTIENAAREPEISDLADFLCKCGAKIKGVGTSVIVISGVEHLKPCEHSVIPDRIAASTYMAAAAITGGDVILKSINKEHLKPVLSSFQSAGCDVRFYKDSLRIRAPQTLSHIERVNTLAYPGFPTDSGPPIIAMTTVATDTSVFVENIFDNRFKVVDELKRLGAQIDVVGRVAIVYGVKNLSGATVMSTDLRGGAALVISGLVAEGVTVVDKIEHKDRGYESIEYYLTALGADIKRID